MTRALVSCACAAVVVSATANATTIDHLVVPPAYDNARGIMGQTFTAVDFFVSGIQVYINDPSRPNDDSVNALVGPADLVLMDATNLLSPTELRRTRILQGGVSASGLTTFLFDSFVPTVVGQRYFFGLDTATDFYGIGLRSLTSSTYDGGGQAFINCTPNIGCTAGVPSGAIIEAQGARDLSFAVLGGDITAVPEPSTLSLLALGAGLAWRRKHSRPLR